MCQVEPMRTRRLPSLLGIDQKSTDGAIKYTGGAKGASCKTMREEKTGELSERKILGEEECK